MKGRMCTRNRLLVLLLIPTLLMAGCVRLRADVEVGKVTDDLIAALKTKNVAGMEKVLVENLQTTIIDNETGSELIEDRIDFLNYFGVISPWTMSKVELTGRKVVVNGSIATVTGAFLQEYIDQCEDFYSKYRRTANLTITLKQINKAWIITELVFSNHSHICVESSLPS